MGTHADSTALEELDVSHEGLPLLLAVKGPIPAAEIGLHVLSAGDCEKPLLHPNIHREGLGYPRAGSQDAAWSVGPSETHPQGGSSHGLLGHVS